MELRTLIIDDEPLARELIQSYIERIPGLKLVGSYNSATEAIRDIISGSIDLIFLDINMPCVDGIELAQITPETTKLVYVTAYEQYAIPAFAAGALDYLLKPVSFPDFMRAVKKAIDWKKMYDAYKKTENYINKHLVVKSDYKTVQIEIDSIKYVEGRRDYVTFFLDKEPYKIVSLVNLKRLENILPDDTFMRVHRSYIVNLSKMKVIDRARIVFDDVFIPISEAYKGKFSEYVNNHSIATLSSLLEYTDNSACRATRMRDRHIRVRITSPSIARSGHHWDRCSQRRSFGLRCNVPDRASAVAQNSILT